MTAAELEPPTTRPGGPSSNHYAKLHPKKKNCTTSEVEGSAQIVWGGTTDSPAYLPTLNN